MKSYWIAPLLALAMAPALAADAPAKKKAAAKETRIVCTSERSTGSHVRRRVCMTQAQQEERRKHDKEAMERMKGPVKPNDIGR